MPAHKFDTGLSNSSATGNRSDKSGELRPTGQTKKESRTQFADGGMKGVQ